ncbi:pentatricopeptide repeat-containing protein At3g42630 isoform X2 [Physcomitrium patens]|uniref:Pentacotripeptide-repeat region of PRORP domain-containing protein n=1 Tax=Physcomitrium patens TaxID=3218 RepID=A0A7I4DMD6_PHYPA|nr:pentatricopeptide repeat-containing protein At3g42630-like isoform X2 [Physcomitrium patens]|eukprot:XP_024374179.1 pentatricopeptide repeat-containing protein At3g42630-like isoform X2 [Physcomitrella patens]
MLINCGANPIPNGASCSSHHYLSELNSHPNFAVFKSLGSPRNLSLGFFCKDNVLCANFSTLPQRVEILHCGVDGIRGGGQRHDYIHPQSHESAENISSFSRELIAGANSVVEDSLAESDIVLHPVENKVSVQTQSPRKKSGKETRFQVVEELRSGRTPFDVLESMTEWSPPVLWAVVDYLRAHARMQEALEQDGYRPCELHYTKFIRMLGQARMPTEARALFIEMCGVGIRPSVVTYTCLLQSYAERGQFEEAELILEDMILSGDAKPNAVTYTGLMHAYGKYRMYDGMWRTFNRMKTGGVPPDEFAYRTLIKAYAQGGLFDRMQLIAKEMSLDGMYADSATLNAVAQAYAEAGLVKEMEKHYEILRKYSFIPNRTTIKAMVWTYVRNSLFFQLSRYVKRVGLKRRTMGNYLWNALLLSRAANFLMDDLRVEFENMKFAGFFPDVTTCNIMAIAYSRMKRFWDLHELIITMQNNGIAPDLVTYGAVIDLFIGADLRPKLLEELVEFRNLDVLAEMGTDPLVFEVFGRGGFLVACETLVRNMEGQDMDQRTYAELIGYYLQSLPKRSRSSSRVSLS